jgi:spermidine synthase
MFFIFVCVGGTLRESLKWASVEKVVMVELDAAVIKASREYLPSYSNCTGFGTPSCFDDERVELYTEDFIKWFDDHIGNDICQRASEKQGLLFDVIILDLLDTETLPEGEAWAEHLYSDLFFQRISCAVNRWGVVVTNFGEAPEGPFRSGPPGIDSPSDIARAEMFHRKIKQIQTMSKFFHNTRVYDTAVPSYRANWAFAIGMVPRLDGEDEDADFERDTFTFGNQGINDFDGKPARVNLKIRRGLLPNARIEYYDGAVQHGFQYPTGDWAGVYCLFPENKQICDLPNLFTTDYEEEFFEKRLTEDGGEASGIYAKKDIKKGHVTGLYDAATRYVPFRSVPFHWSQVLSETALLLVDGYGSPLSLNLIVFFFFFFFFFFYTALRFHRPCTINCASLVVTMILFLTICLLPFTVTALTEGSGAWERPYTCPPARTSLPTTRATTSPTMLVSLRSSPFLSMRFGSSGIPWLISSGPRSTTLPLPRMISSAAK